MKSTEKAMEYKGQVMMVMRYKEGGNAGDVQSRDWW